MAKFVRKGKKGTPGISTASLPDIVFMLLFFFMVATVMKEDEDMVLLEMPKATELDIIEDRSLIEYINIGKPLKRLEPKYGSAPRIQLDDQIASILDIGSFLETKMQKIDEKKRGKFIVSLKADEAVEMGIITDVKQELRKVNALKMMYSTLRKAQEE